MNLEDATTDGDDEVAGDLSSMVTGEGSEDSDGSSGGGGGGGVRGTVRIKGLYGTEQYPPDTECEECGSRAVGVLVKEKRMGNKVTSSGYPLCSRHRDLFKESNPASWENMEFKRFVDQ